MKNIYFTITLFALTCLCQAQIVNIPDANFKNNLLTGNNVDNDGDGYHESNVDTNNDGEIQVSEAEAVLSLAIMGGWLSIETLEGIESFTNMEQIFSHSYPIANADLSQNLNLIKIELIDNGLETLILPNSSNLVELIAWSNNLTNIDVTQNPNLEQFLIQINELTSLDVSQNPNLIRLICAANNLTSLDLTQNPNLERLNFGQNLITEINITQNPNLTLFACYYNEIENLDLSQHQLLEEIYAVHNELTSLNIKNGNNMNLFRLLAYDNPDLTCIGVDDEIYANSQPCDLPNTGWCKDETAAYSENCTLGVNDTDESDLISLYPNPVNSVLKIVNNSSNEITSIKLYDQLGKLVLNEVENLQEINISHLSRGLFLVALQTKNNILTKKMIKE